MPSRFRKWADSLRLDIRLVGVFVAVSLVPLAVSDWMAMSAINRIGESLQADLGRKTTKQVGLQVFDRLTTAAELMQTLAGPDDKMLLARLTTPSGPFASIAPGPRATLASSAANGAGPSTPRYRITAELRPVSADGADVVLRAVDSDGATWLGVVDRASLWSPIVNASGDSTWIVRDARGRFIAAAHDDALIADATPAPSADTSMRNFRSDLYLNASFETDDWTFEQSVPVPALRWQGLPLLAWLTLVGLATLLLIAALAQWLIRRTLAPLQQLAAATRDVAAGALETRVASRRADELGQLAIAFNHMAQRIQHQLASLQSLSGLDQDVLENAPTERIVARIATHLQLVAPHAEATFTWLDGDDRASTAHIERGALRDVSVIALADAARDAFVAQSDVDARSAATPLQLVVRVDGATRGVLALRGDRALADAEVSTLRDFRDRIAVAFAARKRDEELAFQAMHDSLTGLASRRALDAALGDVARGETIALLLVDLDHFKDVNDSRGHAEGDRLIGEAARRLASLAPEGALVARQGGDEFALLLAGDAAMSADAIGREVVRVLAEPFAVGGGAFVLGASVGLAFAPRHAQTGEELLRCADVALYGAKTAGRGRLVEYSAQLDRAAQARVQLEADLRSALSRGEFHLAYQPRVEAANARIVSCEALIRWQHPARGVVAPGEFVPVAEEIGAIVEIGAWVIDEACRQLRAWDLAGVPVRRISVNVSALQLESDAIFEHVVSALSRHAIEPSRLELEITESVLIGDVERVFARLTRIRDTGVTIALDDFGTGQASMATLAALPCDAMKIDRSFVAALEIGERILPIIRSIASMALASGLRLVAEGVETDAQARTMTSVGCHELQGRRFGMPMSSEAFERIVMR